MKILLTGSNGFLGKHITSELSTHQIDTINRSTGVIQTDLKNSIPIINSFYDIIIHCAGKAHSVPKTEEEKADFFAVNVQGTKNLLRGIDDSGYKPTSFIFISTVAVYGVSEGTNIDESHELHAADPYGISKIEAESIVQHWCEERNVICAILRLPLIAGAFPPGNLGAMIRGINKGYYFNIGSGQARKSVVLASDVAKILPKVAEKGGTFNLTDGSPISISEISGLIAKQLNKPNPKQIPRLIARCLGIAGDILGSRFPINSNKLAKLSSDLVFSDDKARRELNWNPKTLKEGFKIS